VRKFFEIAMRSLEFSLQNFEIFTKAKILEFYFSIFQKLPPLLKYCGPYDRLSRRRRPAERERERWWCDES
jgi:hypothetical protein